MINMKMSKEEAKEEGPTLAGFSDKEPKYPYGLKLSVDDDSLEKLGLDTPPAVGTVFTITAKVKVDSLSTSQSEGSDAETYTCWQITDMDTSLKPSDAKSFYSKSNMK